MSEKQKQQSKRQKVNYSLKYFFLLSFALTVFIYISYVEIIAFFAPEAFLNKSIKKLKKSEIEKVGQAHSSATHGNYWYWYYCGRDFYRLACKGKYVSITDKKLYFQFWYGICFYSEKEQKIEVFELAVKRLELLKEEEIYRERIEEIEVRLIELKKKIKGLPYQNLKGKPKYKR